MDDLNTMKAKTYSNRKQLEKLVSFMKNDVQLGRGLIKRHDCEGKWKHISKVLNDLGPPIKTPEKWARVWIDLKSKVKSKIHKIRVESAKCGSPKNFNTLSEIHEKVVEFLNFDTPFPASTVDGSIYDIRPIEHNNYIELSETQISSSFTETERSEIEEDEMKSKPTETFNRHKRPKLFKKDKNDYNKILATYARKTYLLKLETDREILRLKNKKLKLYREEINIQKELVELLKSEK